LVFLNYFLFLFLFLFIFLNYFLNYFLNFLLIFKIYIILLFISFYFYFILNLLDKDALLPSYVPPSKTFLKQTENGKFLPNKNGPAFGKKKAVLYSNCFVNFNKPHIGMYSGEILSHSGVELLVSYEGCCGMPQLVNFII
jgi:Fe-S oxidoreductase